MTENGSEKLTLPLAHHAVLASSIPAIVHRANNCLSVIDGTIALMEEIDPGEREAAHEQCGVLKDLMRHLAFQARVEIEEVGEIEVAHLLSDLEFVLGIIGRFRRCEVELRLDVVAASIRGDRARLYRLLVSLVTERVLAMHAAGVFGSLMRIRFSVRGGLARFMLTDTAGDVEQAPMLWEAFSAEAAALGKIWDYRLSRRVLGNAHTIVLSVPVHRVVALETAVAPGKSERILLVQRIGEDAELFVAVLSEKGYSVEHLAEIPDPDSAQRFDLVLCDEALVPGLPPSLPRVLVLGQPAVDQPTFSAIEKPIKPKELLDRVAGALR